MATISRARLVDAAHDLNKVLWLEPEIDVKLGVGKLKKLVEEAGYQVKATDQLSGDTRAVINELIGADDAEESESESTSEAEESESTSEAEESESTSEVEESTSEKTVTKPRKAVKAAAKPRKAVKAAAKPRKAVKAAAKPRKAAIKPVAAKKATKKSELGRFSPVRRNSSLGKILEACLTDSFPTVGRAAKSVGIDRDKVMPILRRARVTHGIDHDEGEEGELTIILPKGVDAESMWHEPKGRPVKVGNGQIRTRSKYAIDPEMVSAGRLPDKAPVITSAANARQYQKKFNELLAFAKQGRWDQIRNYKVTGSNSYSTLLGRYRDDLLTYCAR